MHTWVCHIRRQSSAGQVYASNRGRELGTQQPEGHESGLSELGAAQNPAPRARIQSMLRDAQGCSGSEQPCTATAQGCLFIAQVAVTCAQVSKRKWNLERSRFGCDSSGYHCQLPTHHPCCNLRYQFHRNHSTGCAAELRNRRNCHEDG